MTSRIDRRAVMIGVGAAGVGVAALLYSSDDGDGDAIAATGESLRDFRARATEGGRVILDRARYPTHFREAPMLAERVRQGQLPPVTGRIGDDPIVVEPLHEIGRYGGTLRRAFVGPGDSQGMTRFAAGPDSFLHWDHDWRRLRPNLARDFTISRDGRVLTLFLRRGMRWSDGAPFTADDIMFWYEDMYLNRRIVTAPSAALRIGGEDVVIRKLDDFTVQYVSPRPYRALGEMLAGYTDIGGPSVGGRSGMGGYAPKHYLSHFHAKYAEEAELSRRARAAGFANWSIHLKNRNDWTLNPELPVLSPWRVVSPINRQTFSFERNPYSVWVDTAGNQLPYVDRISHVLCSGPDAVNFKAVAGELDFQERHLYISKLPFLLRNRERSGYDVYLDPFEGADLGVRINLDYRDDAEIGALLSDRRFRRALSLGLDRDQINETFMLGTGLPTAAVPSPENKYYPGDAWARRWAVFDPAESNRMLDGLGLAERDAQSFRQRRDGSGRLRLVCQAAVGHFDYPGVGEMLRDQWRGIGVDLDVQIVENTLVAQRALAGSIQLALGYAGSDDPITAPDLLFPSTPSSVVGATIGVEFARWFQTNGAAGRRPPDEIVAMMELWREAREQTESGRIRIGRELIARHIDEVLSIGLISGGLAFYGIHIANKNLTNVPRRFRNSPSLRSPVNCLPLTFAYRAPSATEGS